MIKPRGDKGSPYVTLLLKWKDIPGTPLSNILEYPEDRIHLIHDTHFFRETFTFKHPKNHLMLNFIKGFLKIQLEYYNFFFRLMADVQKLISPDVQLYLE